MSIQSINQNIAHFVGGDVHHERSVHQKEEMQERPMAPPSSLHHQNRRNAQYKNQRPHSSASSHGVGKENAVAHTFDRSSRNRSSGLAAQQHQPHQQYQHQHFFKNSQQQQHRQHQHQHQHQHQRQSRNMHSSSSPCAIQLTPSDVFISTNFVYCMTQRNYDFHCLLQQYNNNNTNNNGDIFAADKVFVQNVLLSKAQKEKEHARKSWLARQADDACTKMYLSSRGEATTATPTEA